MIVVQDDTQIDRTHVCWLGFCEIFQWYTANCFLLLSRKVVLFFIYFSFHQGSSVTLMHFFNVLGLRKIGFLQLSGLYDRMFVICVYDVYVQGPEAECKFLCIPTIFYKSLVEILGYLYDYCWEFFIVCNLVLMNYDDFCYDLEYR